MESNEKKSKRPRITTAPGGVPGEYAGEHTENTYAPRTDHSAEGTDAQSDAQGGYHRNYNSQYRQGGYQPRQQGGYQQRQGGYQQRQGGYQPRQGGYQPRQQGEGGYQPRQQGGYQQRQGGYQPRQQGEGGYQPRQQGGYQQRQSGYQPRQQGGYQQRQGGYQPRQQGEGGYQPRQQGGYQQRQGGYQPRQQQGGQRPYGNRQQGGYQQRGPRQNQQGMQRNQFGMPHGGKSFTPRPKRIEYEETVVDPNEPIRLNKYMANAGICSRREADEFIQQGLVKVNGNVVTELGTKITRNDTVEYDEKLVTLERKCYILLNKPKDCVTTSDDPNGRLTVMDLVKGACDERIYPVGRLDRNTTGVLLLTNDGDLASKLTHPKYVKKKIYHVWCDKDIAEDDMQRIADGIELDDGPIHADAISYATMTDRNQAGIEIHSGRNRVVRRIFESLGYHVTKLDRVYFAGLTKKNLPRGRWRYLTQEEVNFLKMGSFE
ncbi:MAG: rRNA pseudouridine synthase [Candidatus Amulumruptor caecigallinarius]|nr:rRNA pseudouridine synthase [Candidatus Amulumruptor caecigallinarius]MCM1397320.1 rRNA pseudouridine synthase [Candidatus Amulumruptor caecigallinarius]MCM1453616.1 rRNA pseudouridine synthase [bacterium]